MNFTGGNWIHCMDRFAVLRLLCIHITKSGFTTFWTLSKSWSRQYSCTNSLNTSLQTFSEIGYRKDHRIKTFRVIEQITGYRYLCVSGHWTDHRMDHRTDCWIQWTNLTISYSGQVRLVSLLYHCMHY